MIFIISESFVKRIFVDRIPDSVSLYFESEGIVLDDVLISLRSDLRIDGSNGDCYVMILKDRFAIAEGILVFSSAGRDFEGKSVRKEDFRVSRFEVFDFADFENPKAEQLISTGRVVANVNGEDRLLYNFSSACKHGASVFCRAINDLKNKGELLEQEYIDEDYEKHVCEKCGRRYPDLELRVCPHCMDKARLAKRLAVLFFN